MTLAGLVIAYRYMLTASMWPSHAVDHKCVSARNHPFKLEMPTSWLWPETTGDIAWCRRISWIVIPESWNERRDHSAIAFILLMGSDPATLISEPRYQIGHSQYQVSGIKTPGFAPAQCLIAGISRPLPGSRQFKLKRGNFVSWF